MQHFCVEFALSPHDFYFRNSLGLCEHMHVRLIGDFKLILDVNGCVFLVRPVVHV